MPIVAPNSDVATTGWAATPPGQFFDAIDESVASDADYISTPVVGATPAIFGLAAAIEAGTHTIRIRASVTTGTALLQIALLDGANAVQGESAPQAITTTPTQYNLPVTTTGEATRVRITVLPDLPEGILRFDGEPMRFDGEAIGWALP